jgi:hypothetical protein
MEMDIMPNIALNLASVSLQSRCAICATYFCLRFDTSEATWTSDGAYNSSAPTSLFTQAFLLVIEYHSLLRRGILCGERSVIWLWAKEQPLKPFVPICHLFVPIHKFILSYYPIVHHPFIVSNSSAICLPLQARIFPVQLVRKSWISQILPHDLRSE